MRSTDLRKLERELHEYLREMFEGLGRRERLEALSWYVTGLLLDGERKSIEPMAARLVDDQAEISSMRQRLQEGVTISAWSDEEVFSRLAVKIDAELPAVEAMVVDDTGFPKKGQHSVGVQRQYSGTLGRRDNCQVATSLHLAGEQGSACIGLRLYLPEAWCSDGDRRLKAKVPDDVEFATKLQIALTQIDAALRWGVRKHVVLADAGYGASLEFREELAARDLPYLLGVPGEQVVWGPASKPVAVRVRATQRDHARTRYVDRDHPPSSIRAVAGSLSPRKVSWRQGSLGWHSSRFAAVRVRTAHQHLTGLRPGEEQWLLTEWTADDAAPTKFWLSSLPPSTSLHKLVRLAKLRWRIERDYQELKQEIGLDHFEGRTWRGFHHHATLCAVAHGFLALRRALFPPEPTEMDAAARPTGAPADPADLGGSLPAVP
jgi:SRSO17 transposase